MSDQILSQLKAAGVSVENLTPQQRDVFGSLSAAETEVVTAIQERLNAVTDAEVEGQGNKVKAF